jgi:aminoglycoside 6'-N-acetyltransferase
VTEFEVVLRPLARDDLPLISRWLAEPHVARWWRDAGGPSAVEAEYLPCITGDDPTEVFAIEIGGRPVGLIQRYLISDNPDWARAMAATPLPVGGAVGIDYLIGDPDLVGRGLGSTVIRTFTELTFLRYPEAGVVSAAVQQDNPASWRALERAGFARLWAGQLDSDDPSDAGPAYVYARTRGAPATPVS